MVVQMLLNCTTRRDFNGKIIGVLAVGQDITLRKRAGKPRMGAVRRDRAADLCLVEQKALSWEVAKFVWIHCTYLCVLCVGLIVCFVGVDTI